MKEAQDIRPAPPQAEVLSVEPYISADYARRENTRLWQRVWQWACRLEEIRNVGDYVTYDIADQSIIVVRTAPDEIKGFHNVCMHRGRRLASGCGTAKGFRCRFHGWQWDLEGRNVRVVDRQDWGDALTDENLRLAPVRVDTWGGYVYVTMDREAPPLREFLEPAATMLDSFEIERMRYRWRKWLIMPCNWKVALEAFNESYHLQASHPQLLRFNEDYTWSKSCGWHAHHGRPSRRLPGQGSSRILPDPRDDVRQSLAGLYKEMKDTLDAYVTDTSVRAAQRLPNEIPEGTPPPQVLAQFSRWWREADAQRGVTWPQVTAEQSAAAGFDWHLFPNSVILIQPTCVLGYRARPNGPDPDSCIFEVYALERAAEGAEPETPVPERCDDLTNEAFWGRILLQDFQNMPEVQRGMKSIGFPGTRPNPVQEQAVINLRRSVDAFMAE
ncbi:MAG: aromatic ring-hydroxylating dioxygenase subunit alpha [Rhodospirillaceae bacterium]|nr:MAG: aromatic ring-hydroxylating dioxygenase subunit alpha [Rhodospirillaceae bacterium]